MSKYEIINKKGYPELFIDGKSVLPVVYALSDFPGAKSNTVYAQRNIRNFGEQGINIVALDTDLRLGWRKNIPFDPEPLIAEISDALEANENAKFMIRLHINAPYWWCKDNLDECVLYRKPDGDELGLDCGEDYVRLIRGDKTNELRASAASEKFLNEACENMIIFLEALKGTPEGEALLGIQPAYGHNGEWHSFGPDVSLPMKEYFKSWLTEKYKTEDAMRESWNDTSVTFDTAEFHPECWYRPGDDNSMRDPRCSQNTTDSQMAYQQCNVDAIIRLCRVAKNAMPNILCGSFYGYIVCTGGNNMTIGGHLGMDTVYKNRDVIDFLAGPACYSGNRKSDGVPMQRTLLESHRLNGLLWLTEMDQAPVGTELYVGGDPEKFNETLSILRRNAIMPLLGGESFWYYDHRLVPGVLSKIIPGLLTEGAKNPFASNIYRKKGWWDNPRIMSEIGKLREFAEKVRERDYSVNADVLIVIDLDSYYYRAIVADGYYTILDSLGRAGLSCNLIYASDIEKCDMSNYKCVIFASSYAISPEQRRLYDELTKNTTVVYLNNHGYCDKASLSEENISAAVSMKMTRRVETAMYYEDGTQEDINEKTQPVFSPEAAGAKVIAKYEDGSAAAVHKDNKIYIPNPVISQRMAEYIIEASGAHRWTVSGEPVVTGFGYVMLNCHHPGKRSLIFPSGRSIEVETDDFETMVFDIESEERVF